jgi:hypothetical protein
MLDAHALDCFRNRKAILRQLLRAASSTATILALLIVFGTVAHHELEVRKMESTEIVFPTTPPPEIKVKVKMPPAPKVPAPPKPEIAKLEPPKIKMPKFEPKPEVKMPMVKETALVKVAAAKPAVVLAPQPKAALAGGCAGADSAAASFHAAGSSGRIERRDTESECNASGDDRGAWQSLRRHRRARRKRLAEWLVRLDLATALAPVRMRERMGKVASAGIPGGNGTAPNGGYGSQGKLHRLEFLAWHLLPTTPARCRNGSQDNSTGSD